MPDSPGRLRKRQATRIAGLHVRRVASGPPGAIAPCKGGDDHVEDHSACSTARGGDTGVTGNRIAEPCTELLARCEVRSEIRCAFRYAIRCPIRCASRWVRRPLAPGRRGFLRAAALPAE